MRFSKIFSVTISIFFVLFGGFTMAQHFWRGETLNPKQVERKWGNTPFDSKKFRDGSEKARAEMASSLLKQPEKFRGKNPQEIRKELGDPDGFYFSEIFPAYLIQTAKTRDEEAWQIVFLLDRKEKVSEVIVHKIAAQNNTLSML